MTSWTLNVDWKAILNYIWNSIALKEIQFYVVIAKIAWYIAYNSFQFIDGSLGGV